MACTCIEIVNEKLADSNTCIKLPIILFGDNKTPRPMVVTEQIETGRGKAKAIGMFATFCPWCGKPYSEHADA